MANVKKKQLEIQEKLRSLGVKVTVSHKDLGERNMVKMNSRIDLRK